MESSSKSSGIQVVDGLITGSNSILTDILINTDGTNDVELTMVDTATFKIIFKATVLGANITGFFNNMNTRVDGGMFVTVVSAGTFEYIVHYK